MIDLKEYLLSECSLRECSLRECGEGVATPGNTLGMGNPIAPGEDVVGSGDIPNAGGTRLKKRKKKIKDGEEHKYDKIKEGLFDDDFGIDIEKWAKEFKKKFRDEIGYGLTNPNVDLFTEQSLEMFKAYAESHQVSSKTKDVCLICIFPDQCKMEIYVPRDNGTVVNYTWYKYVPKKIGYTCQVMTQNVEDYWGMLEKSRYSVCVKKSLLYPIIRRT